jgi:DNA-directed RNA polymerase subunit delta
MKRIIVDYAKLTNEILTLLVERFPDGYDDSNIIRFKNHKNETIEAVEVKTEDTIFLVKISTKLADRIINFDEDDDIIVPLESIKGIDLDDEDATDDDDDEDENLDKPDFDGEDDEDIDPSDIVDEDTDDDED